MDERFQEMYESEIKSSSHIKSDRAFVFKGNHGSDIKISDLIPDHGYRTIRTARKNPILSLKYE